MCKKDVTDTFDVNFSSSSCLQKLEKDRLEFILQKNKKQIENNIVRDLDFIRISCSMEKSKNEMPDFNTWIKAVEKIKSEKSL